ncbi:High affinity cAMP-specific and IBMX-insensitive 3',5'-cyclic phosphodiesterase 9A, partial [Clonorchis sinensis]
VLITPVSDDCEVRQMICGLAGVPSNSIVSLQDNEGTVVSCSKSLPANTEMTPYTVIIKPTEDAFDVSLMSRLLELVNKQIVDLNNCVTINDGIKIAQLKADDPLEKYTFTKATTEYLKKPTFNIWQWEPNEMIALLEHMYSELDLINEFRINPITLRRWVLTIQANYRNNPFHNFRHCFCVTQMMYGMLHLCGLNEKFTKEELGILLTACVCHDLDHPGYNNSYQINARTALAIRYSDISPLENHHCAVAFSILNRPETNIFANVSQEVFQRVRQGMTALILATDMARHGEIIETLKRYIEEGFVLDKKEHREQLKIVLIKCCDISNEVRPMNVSEPWVDCLLEEYFTQLPVRFFSVLEEAPSESFVQSSELMRQFTMLSFIVGLDRHTGSDAQRSLLSGSVDLCLDLV